MTLIYVSKKLYYGNSILTQNIQDDVGVHYFKGQLWTIASPDCICVLAAPQLHCSGQKVGIPN